MLLSFHVVALAAAVDDGVVVAVVVVVVPAFFACAFATSGVPAAVSSFWSEQSIGERPLLRSHTTSSSRGSSLSPITPRRRTTRNGKGE